MRYCTLIILLSLSVTTYSQRTNGFFVQEFCFIDPKIAKELKVDRIFFTIKENGRKTGSVEMILDSNYRLLKKILHTKDSVEIIEYPGAPLSQFACPVIKPGYIEECRNKLITRTKSGDAYRETEFDSAGRVVADKWKPGKKIIEINRKFNYDSLDLLRQVHMEDIRENGTVDKKELLTYTYESERLISVKQKISFSEGYTEAGTITYKYYRCGLVKHMKGTAYFSQWRSEVDFEYYSGQKKIK